MIGCYLCVPQWDMRYIECQCLGLKLNSYICLPISEKLHVCEACLEWWPLKVSKEEHSRLISRLQAKIIETEPVSIIFSRG